MGEAPDPRSFYTELLPAQVERDLREQERAVEAAQRTLEGLRDAKGLLLAIVDEERFWLRVEGGRLHPIADPGEPPLITLVQRRADFDRLVRDAGDSPLAFLGGLAGAQASLALTRGRLEALAGLRGSLCFEVEGEQGFRVLAHFGPDPRAAEPDARIRVAPEVYGALRRGELDAQNAFMQGQLAIDGDVGLAMQVALAALGT